MADAAAISDSIAGSQAVVYLATGGGATWSDFERDFVGGARNVGQACLRHAVRRLVYTSSTAALYLGRKMTIDESAGVDGTGAGRGMYSRAKIMAEGLLQEMRATSQLPVVVVRPGVVVGRGGMLNHSGIGLWPSDTCCIGWGRGNTPLPFVLVDDVARAIVSALDTPAIEGMCFNLAGDVNLSAREFVRLLAERSFRNCRFYPQSFAKMQLLEIGKWLLKHLARKRDNPFPSYRDLKSRSMRSQLDTSAAKKFLNWSPNRSREVFIAEAIESHCPPPPAGDLRLTLSGDAAVAR